MGHVGLLDGQGNRGVGGRCHDKEDRRGQSIRVYGGGVFGQPVAVGQDESVERGLPDGRGVPDRRRDVALDAAGHASSAGLVLRHRLRGRVVRVRVRVLRGRVARPGVRVRGVGRGHHLAP